MSDVEKIEQGVAYTKVRSAYALTLLAMKPGDSIRVRDRQRFNAYRVAAQRYNISIRTKTYPRHWRIWKLGDSETHVAVQPRTRLATRTRNKALLKTLASS